MPGLPGWLRKWQSIWSNTGEDLLNEASELVLLLLFAMPAKKKGKKNKPLWVTHSVPLNASGFQEETFQLLPIETAKQG